jgi:perosamine synthetase
VTPYYFWKGRVAFYAILKALGIGPGDRVIVPGYTCVVVPAAVRFSGAEPLYVDIDPATYNVTLEGLAKAYDAAAGIKAVVVQHTYGLPAPTAPIVTWAKQTGVSVIEDCCHALGSRYRDDLGHWSEVGTLGDASFFSSQWSKPISTGLGGWARTGDCDLERRLQAFHGRECVAPSWFECGLLAIQLAGRAIVSAPSSYWIARDTYRFLTRLGLGIGSSDPTELRGRIPDRYAMRMSALQLRLLEYNLRMFEAVSRHRSWLKHIYDETLSEAGFELVAVPEYADPIYLRYPVRVANKADVLRKAQSARVELGDWFDHPLHPSESDPQAFGYRAGSCKHAEIAANQVVNLPMHRNVTERTATEIVGFLKQSAQPVRACYRPSKIASPAGRYVDPDRYASQKTPP